jgi:predicted O-methyltransferase YrrM
MKDFSKIDAVISDLIARQAAEREKPAEFKEAMLSMGADGGRLIETIVRLACPRRGLEIGTSSGFSALCAMRSGCEHDFHLITVDHDPAKAEWAQDNFDRAGVDENITIVIEDGLEAARKLPGPFDYVLLDAAKAQNLPIIKALLPKLNAGGIVLTDNILTHAEETKDFVEFVRNHPDLASGMAYVGNGIEVTIKLGKRLG